MWELYTEFHCFEGHWEKLPKLQTQITTMVELLTKYV